LQIINHKFIEEYNIGIVGLAIAPLPLGGAVAFGAPSMGAILWVKVPF